MSRAQAIWGAVEVSSKILDCADVGTCGMLSVITALEFFQHYFAKMGHRNTSCDPHLHPSHQATNPPLPHAQRPPPGGYVVCRAGSAARRCKSSTQPDGGEGLAMTQGLSPQGRSEGSV